MPGEVHLWCARLDLADALILQRVGLLNNEERDRANRFYFDRDRRRFIAARSGLRLILARYLAVGPEALRFTYGAQGKPALAAGGAAPHLQFNLSHSGEMALYAVASGCAVGVDLEMVRPEVADEPLVLQLFSSHELGALRRLPRVEQVVAFFQCWARKEAYIKARGGGLSIPLQEFDVSFLPGAEAMLLANRADPEEVTRWSFLPVPSIPGYAAALVVAGEGRLLACWEL